jgi:hypothetical protein
MLKISLQLSNSFYLKMEKNGKLSVDSCDEIAIDKETIDYAINYMSLKLYAKKVELFKSYK